MSIRLHKDLQDILSQLNKSKVRYMIVGGYAVIHHGYNRTTGDLDIWVEQSKENFLLLGKAFKKFGIPISAINETDFLENEKDVYTFGRPPVCIEILTAVKGLKFKDAYANASWVKFDGVKVSMIDARDLIKAKKAAGRYKDLDDLEHIK